MHAEVFFSYNVAKPTRLNNPVRWGVKNSFFTKRILLFINNLQIFRKSSIFVPVLAFQKQIGIRFLPTVEMTTMLGQGLVGEGKSGREASAFTLPFTASRPLSFRWSKATEKSLL
jgi:hypothetical protein